MCFVFRKNNRENNRFCWPSEMTKMHVFRLKMHACRLKTPFWVRFGLNLGLNNLKFGQKAICDWIELIESIGLIQSIRSIRSIQSIRSIRSIQSIRSIRSEMAFWPNFKLFRPKFSPNRTKNGIFSLKTCVFSLKTCVFDQINSIGSIGFTQK